MEDRREDYNARVNFFCMGLGMGALAGLLLAPRRGSETREQMNRKIEEGRQYAQDKVRELRAHAEDAVETGKKMPDRLRQSFEAGRQAYQREIYNAREGTAD
jgi:gas vesicle protein